MSDPSHEQQTREFFKQKADEEGISLRAFCKKYGIIYESFFGKDDYEKFPQGKVYLSQLTPGERLAVESRSTHDDPDSPDED